MKKWKWVILGAVLILLAGAAGICALLENKQPEEDVTYQEGQCRLVMQWPAIGEVPSGLKDVERAVSEITEEEIGAVIELLPVNGSSISSETSFAISSGEQIDLCVSMYTGLGNLVNAGCLIPLEDLIKTYGKNLERICGVQLTGGYYQDRLYGIPVVYSNGTRQGFLCRTDLLEKYRITLDKDRYYSMGELEDIFKKVKAGEGSNFYMLGGSMGVSGTGAFSCEMLWDNMGASTASGVLLIGKEPDSPKIVNLYATEEYKRYAGRMYEWAQSGYIEPDAYMTGDDSDIAVSKGNYFGFFTDDVTEQEGEYSARSGYDMTFIPMREACMKTSSYQSVLWGITKTSAHPEKAMEFLDLLYSDERVINLLQYGIEGESYEIIKSDNQGTVIDIPEGKRLTELPYYNILGIYGNRLKAYIRYPGDTDRNQRIKAFSDSVNLRSPALGYVFDTEKVSAELSAVNEVLNNYMGIINTGSINPDTELPLLLAELESAGIDKIIEENQRQYNRWRKEKS